MPHSPKSSNRGFTLVELASASFLIAVGLLGVYALMRSGLESSSEQERDMRGMLFAESAFETLAVAAQAASDVGGKTNWVAFWEAFYDGSTNLPLIGATSDDWPRAEPLLGADFRAFALAPQTRLLSGNKLQAYAYSDQTATTNTIWYDFNERSPLVEDKETGDFLALAVTLHVWPESPSSNAQTYFRVFSLEER